MTEWNAWGDNWPVWKDAGRKVEVRYDDGSSVVGELIDHDMFFDGESEWPVFTVQQADGSTASFADHKEFRYL